MRLASFDLETHLIIPGLLTPPLVCGSTAIWADGRALDSRLLDREQAIEHALELLTDPDVTIAGANIAFDMGVLANEEPALLRPIFKAYADERIFDVLIAQALDAIAGGHLFQEPDGSPLLGPNGKITKRYSLSTCVRLDLGRDDAKANDFWRMRYAILERVPMSCWPYEAIQYPKDDADNTVEVAAVQLGLTTPYPRTAGATWSGFRNLLDMPAQAETAFALHLGAAWGLRSDPERVAQLEERVAKMHAVRVERYRAMGFIRPDDTENGSAVARAVAKAYGASGACKVCNGTGKVRKVKKVPCRGPKKGARYQGCGVITREEDGVCVTCGGEGTIDVLGNEVICKGSDGGCDGSGLDLDTAPGLPRTDKGGISCSRDTFAESGDDDLADYGDDEYEKVRTSYLPFLREGTQGPINLRPNVLVASGRTSYEGVVQLIPRSCPSCAVRSKILPCTCVRPCIVAREGRVFGSSDYSAGELCTLAQVCLWVVGTSRMADMINETKDPGSLHTALGAKMMGIGLDEMKARLKAKDVQAKNYRQAAKPFNFGAPGGMGAAKLVLTNRKKSAGMTEGPDGRVYSGIRFCILVGGSRECGTEKVTEWKRKDIPPTCKACLELAEFQLRPAWFEAWPEMREYFEWVSSHVQQNGELACFGKNVHRIRGGLAFCDGANNGFQALLADGAKHALRAVTREAYTDESSPLYQARVRVPLFAHDELFTEMNADTAHLAGPRIAEVMIASLREYVPDVYCFAETAIMKHWQKDAEPVYENGKLVLWTPKGAK